MNVRADYSALIFWILDMSAATPYTISVYRDLDQDILHKTLEVSTYNDIPRSEHRDAFYQIKAQGINIKHSDFLVGDGDIEITQLITANDEYLPELIEEIDHLIRQCSSNWDSFNDEIAEILNMDFETKIGYRNPKVIDYGFSESELVLIDILAFIRYGLNYLKNNIGSSMVIHIEETL